MRIVSRKVPVRGATAAALPPRRVRDRRGGDLRRQRDEVENQVWQSSGLELAEYQPDQLHRDGRNSDHDQAASVSFHAEGQRVDGRNGRGA
jgi:hypothetical protein